MANKSVKLTDKTLKRIISESVKSVLSEIEYMKDGDLEQQYKDNPQIDSKEKSVASFKKTLDSQWKKALNMATESKVRMTDKQFKKFITESVKSVLREMEEGNKQYDYLSLIVEISPQTCRYEEDQQDYDRVCEMYDDNNIQGIMDYMMQWEYGEETSDTSEGLDPCERVLMETDTHILAFCPSSKFGWQGDAFFLYRKDRNI